MKTTFDIADNILLRARHLSKSESIPLKVLVEEGLQFVLENHDRKEKPKVNPVTFSGQGLSETFQTASWSEIRNAAYREPS